MNTVNLAVINLLAKDEYEVVVDVYYCYTVFFVSVRLELDNGDSSQNTQ
jgi:hypothetical protein